MASLFATLLGGPSQPAPVAEVPPVGDDFWYSNNYAGQLGSTRTNTGIHVSPEKAMTVSSVHSCVNLISKSIAQLPIILYKYDNESNSRTAQPLHSLSFLLGYRPNKWQTAFDFKALMQMHLLLRGNAYAEIIPGERGAVTWLEPIHPDLVEVERIQDGTLRYRVTEWNGNVRILLQDEIFHIRSPICPTGLVGLSPVAYAKETISLALAAEEHGARVFANGARPGLVVTLKNRLKAEDFQRFKSELNSNFAGVHQSGKTMVLEEGATAQPITLTADEIAFLGTRNFAVEEVARWFDVPTIMLHNMTKQTSFGSGIEQVMLQFVRGTLGPWMEAWQQAIARDLIIAPFLYGAEFDTSRLIKGDMTAMANFYGRLVSEHVIVPNEARSALGYNPTDWGKEPVSKPGAVPGSGDASSGGGSSDNAPPPPSDG